MKKVFFFSLMAVAVCLLTACSKDDVKGTSPYGPSGEGYVAFNIMLPTSPNTSTRANDEWDDGLVEEYQVNDAILLIFAGAIEAAATFQSAYDLNTSPFALAGSPTDGCTTEARLTALLKQKEEQSTDEIYAYVILNGNGVFSVEGTDLKILKATVSSGTVSEEWATIKATPAVTFAEFTKYQLAAARIGSVTKMLMTSAPNCDKQGGASDPSTEGKVLSLAKLNKKNIYSTPEMARSNPAADVYVGRSAVKVQVTADFKQIDTNGDSTPDAFAVVGNNVVTYDPTSLVWTLGNTNKTFYIGRQFDSNWLGLYATGTLDAAPVTKYRFVGAMAIHEGVYRTYWGEDPNYTTDNSAGGTFDNETPAETDINMKSDKVLYTTENTMDENQMKHRNTTYVAVGVQLNGGTKFYTVPNATGDDFIYNADRLFAFVRSIVGTLPEFQSFQDAVRTEKGNPELNVLQYVKVTITDETDLRNVVVKVEFDNSTIAVSAANLALFASVPTAYADKMAPAAPATQTPIYVYPEGMAYYYVPIQHFNNDETPWSSLNKESAAYDDTYPATNRKADYLGRWGVLRNNWYKLTVTGIRHIGKPEPDEPGDEPDDEVDKYISVKIHVMPWTLRRQSVDL